MRTTSSTSRVGASASAVRCSGPWITTSCPGIAGYLLGTTRTFQPGVSCSLPSAASTSTSGGVSRSWPSQNGQAARLTDPSRAAGGTRPGRRVPARSAPACRSAGCDEGLVSSSPNTGTTGLGSEAIVTLSSRFIDATDHPLHLRGNASNGRTRPRLTLRRVRRSLGTGGADRDGRPAGAAVAGDDPRAAHVPADRRELEGRRPTRGARRRARSVDAVVAARARVADVDGRRDDGAAAPLGRRRRHRPAPRVHHQPAGGSLAGGAAGDPDPAGDHHPRRVGRRRVDPPRAAARTRRP